MFKRCRAAGSAVSSNSQLQFNVYLLQQLSLSKPQFLAFVISGSSTLIVFCWSGLFLNISMGTAATSWTAQSTVSHQG